MRILQVTPTFFSDRSVVGGGERYVHSICAAVEAATHVSPTRCDVLSFASERAIIAMSRMTDMHLIPGTPDDSLSCASDALGDLLDSYDVIHVHQCLLPWGIFVAAHGRIAGKVVIGSDHGGGETALLGAYPRLGNVFDVFQAQSDFAVSSFRQLAPPVRVIPGPVDETLVPLSRGPRDHTLIVTLGRILPHKGYERVIEVLPEGITLTIIGRQYDGAYLEFLKARIGRKNVRFETQLDDRAVADLLGRASLYVHSSTHFGYDGRYFAKPELLALAPIEAMCTGTPAIVSRAGALMELSRLRACCSFATDAELANLLRAHLAGKLFDSTPDDIREAAIARYGLAQFGKDYLNLIAECWGSSRARAAA